MKAKFKYSCTEFEDGFIDLQVDEELFRYIIKKFESNIKDLVNISNYDDATEYIKMREQMIEKLNERDNTSTD